MATAWSVDLGHWMEDGDILRSGPIARRAEFIATIVECATVFDLGFYFPVPPRCLARSRRTTCGGIVDAVLEHPGGVVSWECRTCGTHGATTGWEGTRFDLRRGCEEQLGGGLVTWLTLEEWTLLHALRPSSRRARALLAQSIVEDWGIHLELTPDAHAHLMAELREAAGRLSSRGRKRFDAALQALAMPATPGTEARETH